jgi:hypothetical protein
VAVGRVDRNAQLRWARLVSVSALSFVVPVALGALFNREHLNLRQEVAILFSLVSLFLLAQA